MKITDTITPLIKKLVPRMLLMNVPVWLLTLIWGFDLSMIFGLLSGTAYCILAYIYLGKTINHAVTLTKGKAKSLMISCYVTRFLVLGVLGYFALTYKYINFVGLLLPQFYPRIIFTLMGFNKQNRL